MKGKGEKQWGRGREEWEGGTGKRRRIVQQVLRGGEGGVEGRDGGK